MGAFTQAAAEKKPKHYIIGRVKEVEDRGLSAKGNRVIGIKFGAVLSTRQRDERFYLSFKEEWLTDPSFNPDHLERGPKFLHLNNMSGTNGVPPAEALVGTDAFREIAERQQAGDCNADDFVEAIQTSEGRLVGLILAQDADLIEQADGKKKRILQDSLSVGAFFLQGGVADINKYVGKELAKREENDEYKVTARAGWEVDPLDPENSTDPFVAAAEEFDGASELEALEAVPV
jgi:hypothetical protein